MFRSFVRLAAMLVTLLVLLGSFSMLTAAQGGDPASDAVTICQSLRQNGVLDQLGLTTGECVNLIQGPATATANNEFAGGCGWEPNQAVVGASNKGQCVAFLK